MNQDLIKIAIDAIEKLIPLAQMSGCWGDDPALITADDAIKKLKTAIDP